MKDYKVTCLDSCISKCKLTNVETIDQVDDFYTYGNVDELAKYLKKAQTLNTKLELCREKIEQFNMEETAFEWELTGYPLMQATVDKLNPFLGLYETSMEFMNKQKTW
jgi:dynein heavy chain